MLITSATPKAACLICIDGWGLGEGGAGPDGGPMGDAVAAAQPPTMLHLAATQPCVALTAHGEAVGLPAGLMGNSEVGHLNIGAGRVVYQVGPCCLSCLAADWSVAAG